MEVKYSAPNSSPCSSALSYYDTAHENGFLFHNDEILDCNFNLDVQHDTDLRKEELHNNYNPVLSPVSSVSLSTYFREDEEMEIDISDQYIDLAVENTRLWVNTLPPTNPLIKLSSKIELDEKNERNGLKNFSSSPASPSIASNEVNYHLTPLNIPLEKISGSGILRDPRIWIASKTSCNCSALTIDEISTVLKRLEIEISFRRSVMEESPMSPMSNVDMDFLSQLRAEQKDVLLSHESIDDADSVAGTTALPEFSSEEIDLVLNGLTTETSSIQGRQGEEEHRDGAESSFRLQTTQEQNKSTEFSKLPAFCIGNTVELEEGEEFSRRPVFPFENSLSDSFMCNGFNANEGLEYCNVFHKLFLRAVDALADNTLCMESILQYLQKTIDSGLSVMEILKTMANIKKQN